LKQYILTNALRNAEKYIAERALCGTEVSVIAWSSLKKFFL